MRTHRLITRINPTFSKAAMTWACVFRPRLQPPFYDHTFSLCVCVTVFIEYGEHQKNILPCSKMGHPTRSYIPRKPHCRSHRASSSPQCYSAAPVILHTLAGRTDHKPTAPRNRYPDPCKDLQPLLQNCLVIQKEVFLPHRPAQSPHWSRR